MGLTLRLVRHGRTAWSDAGRYSGHADIGLTVAGRREVSAGGLPAGDYVSLVCSDLRRCRETAAALGVAARPDAALRELDFGSMEGSTWEELDAETQAALLAVDGFVAPGGESLEEFAARVDGFVGALGPGLHLLITHGGVIQHLLRREQVVRRVGPGEWLDLSVSPR